MPQNLPAQIVCQSPKVWNFDEKRIYWASVVRELSQRQWNFMTRIVSCFTFCHSQWQGCAWWGVFIIRKIRMEFDFAKVLIRVDVTHSSYASFTNSFFLSYSFKAQLFSEILHRQVGKTLKSNLFQLNDFSHTLFSFPE